MREPISAADFNKLLHMAVEEHDLDPKTTYIEFTWWDGVFRPLTCTDCGDSAYVLVFGEETCNTFSAKCKGFTIPTGFYVFKDAVYANQVLHRPLTVKSVMDGRLTDFDGVKFLFSNSPVNYYVDINPFKTRVYRNMGGETILALYAEDRDSGEWQPFSQMTGGRIRMIDAALSWMACDTCDTACDDGPDPDRNSCTGGAV